MFEMFDMSVRSDKGRKYVIYWSFHIAELRNDRKVHELLQETETQLQLHVAESESGGL